MAIAIIEFREMIPRPNVRRDDSSTHQINRIIYDIDINTGFEFEFGAYIRSNNENPDKGSEYAEC
jgi:hypothetical protein